MMVVAFLASLGLALVTPCSFPQTFHVLGFSPFLGSLCTFSFTLITSHTALSGPHCLDVQAFILSLAGSLLDPLTLGSSIPVKPVPRR